MQRTLLGLGVALLIGLVAGYWIRDLRSGKSSTVSASEPPARTGSTVASLAAPRVVEPGPVRPEPSRSAAASSATGSAAELLRLLQLRKQGMLSFQVQVFDHQHHLSPAAKALLNISDEEAGVLDRTIDDIQRRMAALEAGAAVRDPNAPAGKLVLSIPPYPEQGGRLYDELQAQLSAVLGPERNALLQQVADGALDWGFNGFGTQMRSVTIERASSPDGTTLYKISDMHRQPVGPDGKVGLGNYMSSGSQFRTREEVVKYLGPMGEKLVPTDL